MKRAYRFLLWSLFSSGITFCYLLNVATYWQIDLMRHIFVVECHAIQDIWIVRFGFPIIGDMPIQNAFDLTVFMGFFSMILLSITYIVIIISMNRSHKRTKKELYKLRERFGGM